MTQVKKGIEIDQSKSTYFSSIDTLIFDIDGVLLDVKSSFRQAISRTVQFYFKNILNWEIEEYLLTTDDTQYFKLAGGFNNDWELTYAAVLFFLLKSNFMETRDVARLREEGLTIKELTEIIGSNGGGLPEAVDVLKRKFGGQKWKKTISLWNKKLIKQIFQEYYAGRDYCRKLYGFEPEYIKQDGLLNREKILISPELIQDIPAKLGVLTGRTKEETSLALERTGLSDIFLPDLRLFDNGECHKPDPICLKILADRAETKLGLYLGDTTDDIKTVLNFNRERHETQFLSAQVSRNEEEMRFFLDQGADLVGLNTVNIVEYLKERLKNG